MSSPVVSTALLGGDLLGVDAGSPTSREAEHLGQALLEALGLPADGSSDVVLCVHPVREGVPHEAITVRVPTSSTGARGPDGVVELLHGAGCTAVAVADAAGRAAGAAELRVGARVAVDDLRGGAGRAVVFPGCGRLRGRLTVAELFMRSGVERARILGGASLSDDAVIDTRDFVRPLFVEHVLELALQPAAGGVLVPFEVRDPTPCCAAH